MNKISIIIATKNRPHFLKNCLSSILSNKLIPEEIIIIEQGSGNQVENIIKNFKNNSLDLIYIKDLGYGRSRALNFGIKNSQGDILGFTDDDCVVSKDWILNLKEEVKSSPDFSAITGRVLAEPGFEAKEFLNLVKSTTRKETTSPKNPWRIGCSGCNMFIKREVFDSIGYFDERLGSGSEFKSAMDGDIIYRILKANGKVIYSPDILVYHNAWREKEDNALLRYNYAIGLGAFAGKHLVLGDVYPSLFISYKFLLKIRRLLIGLLIFDKERILDGYSHIKGIAVGFFKMLFYKDRVQGVYG